MRSRAYHVRYRELPYVLLNIILSASMRSRAYHVRYRELPYVLLNIILSASMRSRAYHVRYRELPYGLMKYYIIYINALSRISRSLSRTALCFY